MIKMKSRMKFEMVERIFRTCFINFMRTLYVYLLLFLFVGQQLSAIPIPDLARRVTDAANILSASTITQIEADLKSHEEATSNQIAVLTVPSLEGESIEEVAVAVFEKWKLGQKSKSNGVLLIIAPNDRKMRIEVGYGLEGALTDLQASQIIKKVIRPKFKAGDMDGGVREGVTAIIGTIKGEYKPESTDVSTTSGSELGSVFSLVPGFFLYVLAFVFSGFVSIILLIFSFRFLNVGLLAFLPSILANLATLGFLIGFVIFKFRKSNADGSGGGFFDGFSGGGGWSSSSDSWSSSDSGGSWGGGGGDSGGGGSSGDW